MRDQNPEVDPFLAEIGNTGLGIPYYAVFVADSTEPIQFDGIFLDSDSMIEKIQPAVATRAANSAPPMAIR